MADNAVRFQTRGMRVQLEIYKLQISSFHFRDDYYIGTGSKLLQYFIRLCSLTVER